MVFLYGGYSPSPNRGVRHYTDDGSRVAIAGRPADQRARRPHQARARERRPAALLRGADARAATALPAVLGRSSRGRGADRTAEASARIDWKLTGGYTHVNRRLRALRADESQRPPLRDPRRTDRSARHRRRRAPAADAGPRWLAAVKRRQRSGPDARRRASSSALCAARAASAPPSPPTAASSSPRGATAHRRRSTTRRPTRRRSHDDDLPGGARAGIFVHDLLERVPLETLRGDRRLRGLGARATTSARCSRRRCAGTGAIRGSSGPPRAWPTPRSPRRSPSWAACSPAWPTQRATRARWSSCSPSPRRPAAPTAATSKGSSTSCSSTRGASTSATGRPIASPSWDEAVVEAHVAKNYALQEQLYALALVRMLGIASAADYEARFGGTLYLFVRGLPRGRHPQPPPELRRDHRLERRDRRRASARRRRCERAASETLATRLGRGAGRRRRRRGEALYLALEAASWPRELSLAERRAFALLVLASCEARTEGATRLALAAGRQAGSTPSRSAGRRRRRSRGGRGARRSSGRPPGAGAARRTSRRPPAVHRRRRLPLSGARPPAGGAPRRRARRADRDARSTLADARGPGDRAGGRRFAAPPLDRRPERRHRRRARAAARPS